MKRNNRKKSAPVIPPVPCIEYAIERVQDHADRSWLAQQPYAQFIEGFGWIISSTYAGGTIPEGAYQYDFFVLPRRYFS